MANKKISQLVDGSTALETDQIGVERSGGNRRITVDMISDYVLDLVPDVQSDWDEADSEEPDFIKNKPTIPTVASASAGDMAISDASQTAIDMTADVHYNPSSRNLELVKSIIVGDTTATDVGTIKYNGSHFYGKVGSDFIQLDNIPGFALIPAATAAELSAAITTINADYSGGFILLTANITLTEEISADTSTITIYGQGHSITQASHLFSITGTSFTIWDTIFINDSASNRGSFEFVTQTVASLRVNFYNCTWVHFQQTMVSEIPLFAFGEAGTTIKSVPDANWHNCLFALEYGSYAGNAASYQVQIYMNVILGSTKTANFYMDMKYGQGYIIRANGTDYHNLVIDHFEIIGVDPSANFNYIRFVSTGEAVATCAFTRYVPEIPRVAPIADFPVGYTGQTPRVPGKKGEISFEMRPDGKLRINILSVTTLGTNAYDTGNTGVAKYIDLTLT